MGNFFKNGKLVKSRAKASINPIDFDSLESRIKRARDNKNELLGPEDFSMISFVVSNQNPHPTKDESPPIPGFLRDFLSELFLDLCSGKDPEEALLMKQHGSKKHYSISDRFLVCDLVNQMLIQDMGYTKAYKAVAQIINERFLEIKTEEQMAAAYSKSPAWKSFYGRKLAWSTVRDWYQEYDAVASGARLIEKK